MVLKVPSAPMCAEHKQFKAGLKVTSMGHEAAGEVVEVARASKVKVGDRVAILPGGDSCGVCEYCQAGNTLHCQQCVDSLRKAINLIV